MKGDDVIVREPKTRTVSIGEAARILGIGRDLAYTEARKGSLAGATVLRIGNRMVIPRAELERVLGERIEEEESLVTK